MADTKISSLVALTGAGVDAAADLIPIVDVSATTAGSKKITVNELKTAFALGDAAAKNTGTTAGTVAAGDDSRITGAAAGPASAVDNGVARYDSTTGKLLQDSPIKINDNATASPNNTINAAQIEVTGSTATVALVLTPKSTGAVIIGPIPDGTTAGGNVRGAEAFDAQRTRNAATDVASGSYSALIGTLRCRASGGPSAVIASDYSSATAAQAVVIAAFSGQATNSYTLSTGYGPQATAQGGFAHGSSGLANRDYIRSHGLSTTKHIIESGLWCDTTNATPTEMFINGTTGRHTIASGKSCSYLINIHGVKSDGSAEADYWRIVRIKNVAGTTSLGTAVLSAFTDHEDNASTDVSITADNTNDSIKIEVTGITSETWRWTAVIFGTESSYAS